MTICINRTRFTKIWTQTIFFTTRYRRKSSKRKTVQSKKREKMPCHKIEIEWPNHQQKKRVPGSFFQWRIFEIFFRLWVREIFYSELPSHLRQHAHTWKFWRQQWAKKLLPDPWKRDLWVTLELGINFFRFRFNPELKRNWNGINFELNSALHFLHFQSKINSVLILDLNGIKLELKRN